MTEAVCSRICEQLKDKDDSLSFRKQKSADPAVQADSRRRKKLAR